MLNVRLEHIFFADIQNRTFDIMRLLFVCFAYINVGLKKFSFIFFQQYGFLRVKFVQIFSVTIIDFNAR